MRLLTLSSVVAFCAFMFGGAPQALASHYSGVYTGRARIMLDGERQTVDVILRVDDSTPRITLIDGEVEIELDAKVFIDRKGVFVGLLFEHDGDDIVAGVGGRINGRSSHARVIGRFIQEGYSRPFILKKFSSDPDAVVP